MVTRRRPILSSCLVISQLRVSAIYLISPIPYAPFFIPSSPIADKKEEKTGLIAKLGLDDWKFALPMGLFVGIPALSNEVIF
jgi:hypothetical protein